MQDEIGSESEPESDENSTDSEMDDETAVAKARAFAAAVKSTSKSAAAAGGDTLAAAMAELDMDNYDDNDDQDLPARRLLGAGNPGMAYHRNPKEDPYLRDSRGNGSDSDDSEEEDLRIRDDDLLILAARNDEDVSHLEMWVYEEADERGEGNLYVHHAILLPAFPLALAWMDVDPTRRQSSGNFAAVGSFEPGIEIWNMDVLDAVEPVATLGGADYEAARALAEQEISGGGGGGKKDKKKKKKSKKKGESSDLPQVPVKPGSHEDAVLGLSWNREFRNVLASCSADTTVKVWDVAECKVSHTLTYHTNKVQAVAWNPAEGQILLSGGFDQKVCMADMRTPDGAPASWDIPADVEALAWDPHNPTSFAVSAENGEVLFYDARGGAGSKPLMQLAAHSKATSALAFNPAVKGMILTASTDKKIKLWGLDVGSGTAPELLASEDLKVGAIFSASFCRDAPMVLAAGGAKGAVAVWDTTNKEAVNAWVEKHQ
jgi:periodic tryptophan protein 1